jgi:RNA polymerase sigma-70 factor (ECF subfamily)
LVAAALAGSDQASARLVERYRAQLQLHCYRMLGSLQDAEDVVQETFLRAWRRLSTFQGRSTFRSWRRPSMSPATRPWPAMSC